MGSGRPHQRYALDRHAIASLLRHRGPVLVAAISLCWCLSIWWRDPFNTCPKGFVCIENAVGGNPSRAEPYVEYVDVTSTASVYRVSSLIKTVQSPYQLVQVYESLFFGKILTIDGALMITERDEANYHETLVHTTLNYLPEATRVLVIGGGDGGTVTRLAQHPNLREIVWCEIDEVVIQFAREYFPSNLAGINDPRVQLRLQNAATFVQEARYPVAGVNNGTFDLILIDSTDFGQADSLFTPSFYEDCKALLSPNGILAFNLDSPQWGQIRTAAASEQMARLFKHAYIFQLCAPRPPPPHARRAATHPRAKLPF